MFIIIHLYALKSTLNNISKGGKIMKNEIILFENQDIRLEVNLKDETVWLSLDQMSELFGRDKSVISRHIKNALSEEVDNSTVAFFATVQKEGQRQIKRNIEYYNLDMIISVGLKRPTSSPLTNCSTRTAHDKSPRS